MTKEQLIKIQALYSTEFKCVVFIMDMLRKGQISTSSTNEQVYDKLIEKLDECSGITQEYEQQLEILKSL